MSECPYCKDKPDEKDARMHPYGGSCMHVRWDISPWGSGHCLPPFGDDRKNSCPALQRRGSRPGRIRP